MGGHFGESSYLAVKFIAWLIFGEEKNTHCRLSLHVCLVYVPMFKNFLDVKFILSSQTCFKVYTYMT